MCTLENVARRRIWRCTYPLSQDAFELFFGDQTNNVKSIFKTLSKWRIQWNATFSILVSTWCLWVAPRALLTSSAVDESRLRPGTPPLAGVLRCEYLTTYSPNCVRGVAHDAHSPRPVWEASSRLLSSVAPPTQERIRGWSVSAVVSRISRYVWGR